MKVLYEDNHVIVVDKPQGVAVQAARQGEVSFVDTVKAFLKKRDKRAGNVFLAIVHRLDRAVGGVMIFAKTSKAAARLSKQVRERTIQKMYRVVVCGVVEKNNDRLIHYVKKVAIGTIHRAIVVKNTDLFAKRAVLDYVVEQRREGESVLSVFLHTGRFHQIRVQLAAIGHPIVGDTLYGARLPFPNRGIALWSQKLCFRTVVGGKQMCVERKMASE